MCVLPLRMIWHGSGKFDQYLSLCCNEFKLKLQTGPGYWFMWESCEIWFPKFTDNFGSFFKNALERSCNSNPIEITRRKMVPFCYWRLHILWHFTVPAYRPFQMRAWSCITSHPLRGLPYLAYDNVNPAMVNSMMLRSSVLAFEKVYRGL